MGDSVVHRGKRHTLTGAPLPIRDGLNATRARVPLTSITAWDFLWHLISTQRHRHPNDNEDALQERFDAGEVVLRNGTRLQPRSILSEGQDVYFYRMPAKETPVPYDIPILFEDHNLLVVDKPPFMATMPRARHIVETATVRLRRITGNDELSPAHRLDRLTSGILLFTKRREIRGAYQTLFAQRRVEKTYEAIAAHAPIAPGTRWESRIEKTPGEIQGRLTPGSINAITDVIAVQAVPNTPYEALHGPLPDLARYTLKPQTGKTHQLRLHMWAAGVPILGDPVYPIILPADAEDMRVPMHLTAAHIAFIDPFTGTPREFESKRPLRAHNVLAP